MHRRPISYKYEILEKEKEILQFRFDIGDARRVLLKL
jgi:hypothetical protein